LHTNGWLSPHHSHGGVKGSGNTYSAGEVLAAVPLSPITVSQLNFPNAPLPMEFSPHNLHARMMACFGTRSVMIKSILQVEDSEDDALLLQLAFKKAGVANPIITVSSGDEAICYLKGEGAYSDRDQFPIPKVILVDLKLPGLSGFQVLEWMKRQPQLKGILIFAITGHHEIGQVNRAYSLGARSFLTKPFDAQDVANLVKAFKGFWVFNRPD
jgi:CheY-like chemotaxis protein